jgi:hypothetical protein
MCEKLHLLHGCAKGGQSEADKKMAATSGRMMSPPKNESASGRRMETLSVFMKTIGRIVLYNKGYR